MNFHVNDGETRNLDELHGEPVNLDDDQAAGCPETDTPDDTQADPAVTGACPTDHLADQRAWADWSDETLIDNNLEPEPEPEPVVDHQPWSHTLGVIAAVIAITAAAIAVVVAATTVTPAPVTAPAPPAPAPVTTTATTTDTETDTVTVTTEPPPTPTPAPYVAPFNPTQITRTQRAHFYADLDTRDVTIPHLEAYQVAIQTCRDLDGIRQQTGTVTTDDLQHEQQSWHTIDPTDTTQIMGAAIRDFPTCY